MRRPAFLIFVNALILVVVVGLLTQSLLVTQRLGRARAVVGRAWLRHGGGEFRLLSCGDVVRGGDTVRTEAGSSAELEWPGGTSWKALPGTQVLVKRATGSRSGGAERASLELSAGEIQVRLAPPLSTASRFEVRTPGALAQARDAVFSVAIVGGKTQAHTSKDSEGSVTLLNDKGQKAVVGPGEIGTAVDSSVESHPGAGARQPSLARPQPGDSGCG